MVSEAKMKANHKYDAKAYDKFLLRMKKADTPRFLDAVAKSNLSKNAFIVQAIMHAIEQVEKDWLQWILYILPVLKNT